MLADPAFEDMDELKATLTTLKAKRDKAQEALGKAKPSPTTHPNPHSGSGPWSDWRPWNRPSGRQPP